LDLLQSNCCVLAELFVQYFNCLINPKDFGFFTFTVHSRDFEHIYQQFADFEISVIVSNSESEKESGLRDDLKCIIFFNIFNSQRVINPLYLAFYTNFLIKLEQIKNYARHCVCML
jgi:hypothetical protein